MLTAAGIRANTICSLYSKRLESTWPMPDIRQIALDESLIKSISADMPKNFKTCKNDPLFLFSLYKWYCTFFCFPIWMPDRQVILSFAFLLMAFFCFLMPSYKILDRQVMLSYVFLCLKGVCWVSSVVCPATRWLTRMVFGQRSDVSGAKPTITL